MMKDWQHGHELKDLLELESFYSEYNKHSFSPFSAMKKNTIASGLHNNTFKVYDHEDRQVVMLDTKVSKTRSSITMYGTVALGVKEKGDRTITKLAWVDGEEQLATELLTAFREPCWLFVWAEDEKANQIAKGANFNWVGTKVTTFAELYAVYFREAEHRSILFDDPRVHPTRLVTEDYSLERANLGSFDVSSLAEDVVKLDIEFTNHYSNYNKRKSWSALSLRGYTKDPEFITKPVEMNKKWQLEHINKEFVMQDTELRKSLPQVEHLLNKFPGDLHRVRLMSLSPKGGELKRHTDQVDPDSGVQDGKIMRFHFPLTTNESVVFSTWEVDGTRKNVHMKTGECWYLDTRKPHQAINNGDTNRIHLVVDVEANKEVRRLIDNDISF
jgi:WD40 repeat protein